MRILIDSNILISAALNAKSTPYQAFLKAVTYPNKAVICEQNIEELKRIFHYKFPEKIDLLEQFLTLALLVIDVIPTPNNTVKIEELIRDSADRPIIRAAVMADVDIIITGDKDFLESGIHDPKIMTASEFVNM